MKKLSGLICSNTQLKVTAMSSGGNQQVRSSGQVPPVYNVVTRQLSPGAQQRKAEKAKDYNNKIQWCK